MPSSQAHSGPLVPITLSLPCGEQKRHNPINVKFWEVIADNLSKAGWSWGCVSALDSEGRTIWIADAHCGDGKRFIVRADETLTAFVELKSAIRACGELPRQVGEISPKLPEYENPHSTSSNPSRDGTCLPNLRGEGEGE
jgi:hypothetical protein